MSKLRDALRELQASADKAPKPVTKENSSAQSLSGKQARPAPSRVSNARTRFGGPRHAINRPGLVQAGLLPTSDQARSVADEFRLIKRPLIENLSAPTEGENHYPNIVMIASARPGVGKTFCSVNLAAGIALERELNVLLVDADVAKPHITSAFDLEGRPGLIDVLEDDRTSIDDVLVHTDLNEVQVLPAGQRHSHSTELIASERMTRVLTELATKYSDRVIIMDSPPLLATSEAQALSQKAGQIVLIIEYGKTLQADINEVLELLDSNKPVNVILNKCLGNRSGGYYGGRYGHYGIDYPQE